MQKLLYFQFVIDAKYFVIERSPQVRHPVCVHLISLYCISFYGLMLAQYIGYIEITFYRIDASVSATMAFMYCNMQYVIKIYLLYIIMLCEKPNVYRISSVSHSELRICNINLYFYQSFKVYDFQIEISEFC